MVGQTQGLKMRLLAGICAAGNSSRMGFDKLSTPPSLHSPDTLLRRAITAAKGHDILVALPPDTHPYFASRRAILRRRDAFVCVEQANDGLSATLKCLAKAAISGGYDGLIVMLADLPFITAAHLDTLVALFETFEGTQSVRAMSQSGRDGHPVIFPVSLLPEFDRLTGDHGAQELMAKYGAKRVEMPSEAATWDMDTLEDWRQM